MTSPSAKVRRRAVLHRMLALACVLALAAGITAAVLAGTAMDRDPLVDPSVACDVTADQDQCLRDVIATNDERSSRRDTLGAIAALGLVSAFAGGVGLVTIALNRRRWTA